MQLPGRFEDRNGMRIIAGICCVLLLAGCGPAADEPGAARPSSTPSRAAAAPSPTRGLCGDAALDDKQVTFPGPTGTYLAGYVLGAGDVTLVLAPQAGATGCSWLAWAREQAAAGYRVLAFDFNGEGRSRRADTGRNSGDVAAAAAYARAGGTGKVVLIGASRGATATLVAAAALNPPPTAVISLSGPATYGGEDAAQAVARLSAPVLYVAAKGDSAFAANAQTMYDATPGSARRLVLVEGALHGTGLLTIADVGAAEAAKAVGDFLRTTTRVT
ncbi:alpha/beta fold hydrolase [Dactylosporangium vinaceum]|uniref:Alpha/beta hydrolase n=1 Tax=Dactylosporangium vinaceum TaxID=53362 RepID=A0ABV5MDS5_9ACTN|nr:alpha/beta fold hydrolase [Dactylosporangium vinaceum]UAC01073.1 alpha/beta fold hydrolase [Dactylosporangium vinaceum]